MKVPELLTTKRLIIALLLVHAIPLAVTVYHEALLSMLLPFVWCVALPFVGFMLWKQKDSIWRATQQQTSLVKVALITTLVFSLFLLLSWFMAQMSLQVQPVMFSAQDTPVLVSVAANETLAYVIRNALQAWLVIIGIALAYNLLPKVRASGFLSNRFDKLAVVAWLFDWVVFVGLMMAVFLLMTFFVVNFGGTVLTLFGTEQVLMPMLSMVVFAMIFYMLNYFSGFSKSLREKAKDKLSFAGVLLRQTAFAVIAWLLAAVFMKLLPMSFLSGLHIPIYFPYLNVERYMQSWNFLILSWPFFLAPVLGVYLAKCAAGKRVFTTSLIFSVVPLLLAGAALIALPSVASAFMQWQPLLHLQEIALNNDTARFYISLGTILFILSFAALLVAMKCSKRFSEALVVVMPDRHGRREYRGRQLIAHFFFFFAGFLMIYLILGVYGLFFAAATYFLSVLSAIILLYYKGITYNKERESSLKLQIHEAVS